MRARPLDLTRLCAAAVVIAACAKKDAAKTDSAAAADSAATVAAPAPAPAPLALADLAGKWNMRSVPESGDTTPTTYVLTATADSSGWTLAFPKGPTVRAHVTVMGDSLMMSAGPYASVRRKGVQVTTNAAFRREGDRLVGTTVAHYKTTKPDSVLRLRSEGTKAP